MNQIHKCKKAIQLFVVICFSLYMQEGLANTDLCKVLFDKDVLSKKADLDAAFTDIYSDNYTYQCDYCHGNVIRLFESLTHQLPHLQPNEFKVLYITTQKWIEKRTEEASFHVQNARDEYSYGFVEKLFGPKISQALGFKEKPKKFVNWKFHVVLEYQGRIYDLDYTNKPQPIEGADYLDKFFITQETIDKHNDVSGMDYELQGKKEDLFVFVIPGEKYLLTPPHHTNTRSFHSTLLLKNTPVPLVTYLKQNHSSPESNK